MSSGFAGHIEQSTHRTQNVERYMYAGHSRFLRPRFVPTARPDPRPRPRFVPTQTTAPLFSPSVWYCPRSGVANERTPANVRGFSLAVNSISSLAHRPTLSRGTNQRAGVESGELKQPPPLAPGQSTPLEGATQSRAHDRQALPYAARIRGEGLPRLGGPHEIALTLQRLQSPVHMPPARVSNATRQ